MPSPGLYLYTLTWKNDNLRAGASFEIIMTPNDLIVVGAGSSDSFS
jgi:hypothetical protein